MSCVAAKQQPELLCDLQAINAAIWCPVSSRTLVGAGNVSTQQSVRFC